MSVCCPPLPCGRTKAHECLLPAPAPSAPCVVGTPERFRTRLPERGVGKWGVEWGWGYGMVWYALRSRGGASPAPHVPR